MTELVVDVHRRVLRANQNQKIDIKCELVNDTEFSDLIDVYFSAREKLC